MPIESYTSTPFPIHKRVLQELLYQWIISYRLWFDVEEGYNTTEDTLTSIMDLLWFDVEEGYNTTLQVFSNMLVLLWFDVEEGYNTTQIELFKRHQRCGLM